MTLRLLLLSALVAAALAAPALPNNCEHCPTECPACPACPACYVEDDDPGYPPVYEMKRKRRSVDVDVEYTPAVEEYPEEAEGYSADLADIHMGFGAYKKPKATPSYNADDAPAARRRRRRRRSTDYGSNNYVDNHGDGYGDSYVDSYGSNNYGHGRDYYGQKRSKYSLNNLESWYDLGPSNQRLLNYGHVFRDKKHLHKQFDHYGSPIQNIDSKHHYYPKFRFGHQYNYAAYGKGHSSPHYYGKYRRRRHYGHHGNYGNHGHGHHRGYGHHRGGYGSGYDSHDGGYSSGGYHSSGYSSTSTDGGYSTGSH